MKAIIRFKGGPGSGHHGHRGVPGQRGGSLPGAGGGGSGSVAGSANVQHAINEMSLINDMYASKDKVRKYVEALPKEDVQKADQFLGQLQGKTIGDYVDRADLPKDADVLAEWDDDVSGLSALEALAGGVEATFMEAFESKVSSMPGAQEAINIINTAFEDL